MAPAPTTINRHSGDCGPQLLNEIGARGASRRLTATGPHKASVFEAGATTLAEAPPQTYTYTAPPVAAAHSFDHVERGPPPNYDRATAYVAADHRSRGDSARPQLTTSSAGHDYGDILRSVQITRSSHVVEVRVGEIEADLAVIQPFQVAAETAPLAIEASTRVAPWAGRSLSRVTSQEEIMYRVWGGDAGQAGAWITPGSPQCAPHPRSPHEKASHCRKRTPPPTSRRCAFPQALGCRPAPQVVRLVSRVGGRRRS
jgi:hypothetical protein